MAEEGKVVQMTSEPTQEDRIKNSIAKLKGKQSKFLFFVASSPNPAASIYEIYFHAKTVMDMGYNVKILTDSAQYQIPDWIEKELTDIPHESMEQSRLTVGPEDVLVIPEIFSNVMEQTKNLPAMRVGFLQSVDYMVNALMPGVEWKSFGVDKIITTSENLKDFIDEFYGKGYQVKTYNPAIPEYFKYNDELKRPVISIVGRNPNEIAKVVKLFYAKYPQYSWVTFDSMLTDSKPPQPMKRKDYAEKLKHNFAGVWVDRIASFGTFPLECMAAGTIPIGLVPDIPPAYILDENDEAKENVGVWTNDILALPILIGDVVTKFLDDTIGDEVIKTMGEVSSKYNVDDAKSTLSQHYQEIIDERLATFEQTLEKLENKEEITEEVKND